MIFNPKKTFYRKFGINDNSFLVGNTIRHVSQSDNA